MSWNCMGRRSQMVKNIFIHIEWQWVFMITDGWEVDWWWRNTVPVESALNFVRITMLRETPALLLPWGCVYVFSILFCYFRSLDAHEKVKTWGQNRHMSFLLLVKHGILTGYMGQLPVFCNALVFPQSLGCSQRTQWKRVRFLFTWWRKLTMNN